MRSEKKEGIQLQMLTNSDNTKNDIKVRFAPSPTGMLHMGNVRAALFNYLFALKNKGTYLLRIDDTDLERSKAEFEQAIYDNLNWLGIKWNETFHQSERFERYNQVIKELKAKGLIYACYETAEELEYKRVRLRARGKPPVYDREGLNLSLQKKQAYEAEGRKPHYRFLLNQEEVRFNDLFRGDCAYNCANLSDPIIIREDGSLLYMLPSVIDDLDYNITHIIRGEDHITNAAVQIQMFNAIGGRAPIFGHFPLITGMDGKLSKRLGSLSIGEMKKQGIEPMAINTLIATLGTANPVKEPYKNLQEAAVDFDISGFGRSQPKFDVNELEHFNLRVIHNMDFNDVKKRLNDNITLDFWEIVKPNLEKSKMLLFGMIEYLMVILKVMLVI